MVRNLALRAACAGGPRSGRRSVQAHFRWGTSRADRCRWCVVRPSRPVLFALALAGCSEVGATPASESRLPRIVESPEPKVCSAEVLQRAAPWVGTIRRRTPTTVAREGSPRIAEQWVLCGALDRDACVAWSARVGALRAGEDGLQVEVRPGRRHVGKLWTFARGDDSESHLFPNNAAAAAFLEARGESFADSTLSRDDAFEPRAYRVDLVYRAPRTEQPAIAWEWELPATSRATRDATLAVEDLADRGIALVEPEPWDLGRRLDEALRTSDGPTPGPAASESLAPLRIRVLMACDASF